MGAREITADEADDMPEFELVQRQGRAIVTRLGRPMTQEEGEILVQEMQTLFENEAILNLLRDGRIECVGFRDGEVVYNPVR